MAMIDYGAIVFKNGKFINKNEFFMDMEKAVGWVDVPNILYPDCDHTYDYDGRCSSDCGDCPRAQYEDRVFEGEHYKKVTGDCRGNSLHHENQINGNYFAYIGNKKLTLAFYKCYFAICVDGKHVKHIWGTRDELNHDHMVLRENINGIDIVIKKIAPTIYTLSVVIDGDHYHVIYGYGIDSSPRIWNKIKVRYIGKKYAKDVDKLIAKYWNDKS